MGYIDGFVWLLKKEGPVLREGIPGFTISAAGGNSTQTGRDGSYKLDGLPTDGKMINLKYSHPRYTTKTKRTRLTTANPNRSINIDYTEPRKPRWASRLARRINPFASRTPRERCPTCGQYLPREK